MGLLYTGDMKVSVVVPAYNEERWIGRLLESLLKQTILPLEVIVVNNASTDKTRVIVAGYKQKFKSKGMRLVLVNEPIKGVGQARNAGAKRVEGEILVFLDADCVAASDHIKLVREYFDEDSGLIHAGSYEYSDGGKLIRWLTGPGQYLIRVMGLFELVFGVKFFLGGNVAIASQVFWQAGGWNATIRDIEYGMDDVELALRLQKLGYQIKFHPELSVISSLRRVKRSPQVTLMRVFWLLVYLYRSRLKQ